ncbi:MAG: 4-hydroxybenzoyl-CoA thioesterase [Dinoroseobacter sp.]|jgi:4-hydroxybenzoyl-CoA thioesterase|nr:4-hydroxybenzoyl-CoA thioesterase [Dinoroseobacter sp.]
MLTSRRTVLIEWGDCDPADIVFYPNYFRWFDASTAAHFRSAGLPKPKLVTDYNVVGFPMVDTRARFLVPSRYGDEVVIETRIAAFGRSSFEVEHRLMRGDVLAVEGFEKRVLVAKSADGAGLKSVPVPEDIRALFTGDDT